MHTVTEHTGGQVPYPLLSSALAPEPCLQPSEEGMRPGCSDVDTEALGEEVPTHTVGE